MEMYEEMEGNAFNAGDAHDPPDATAATSDENLKQPAQMADQGGVEAESDQLGWRALKPTTGNGTKRLRTRQETRLAIKAGKIAESVIRQMGSQERPIGKEKMKAWKQVIMQEVAQEIQAVWQAHEEVLHTQRNNFQAELERVNKRLHHLEAQSPTSENKMTSSKTEKCATNERSTQSTLKVLTLGPSIPKVRNALIVPTSGPKISNRIKSTKLTQKSYA